MVRFTQAAQGAAFGSAAPSALMGVGMAAAGALGVWGSRGFGLRQQGFGG